MGFIDLEKAFDMVNREALWQVLRMYDGGRGKLVSGVKGMYVDNSACVRVKGGEGEGFRIGSMVRQGCIMSPWLFNIYIYVCVCMCGWSDEGGEDSDGKEESELPGGWVKVENSWTLVCR